MRALWAQARKLTGEELTYAEEGELVYGIEPRWHDEEPFRVAAAMLEEALPGEGDLRARLARWQDETAVPAAILEPALRDVAEELRRLTQQTIGLPEGEDFELELVTDKRWLGYARYLGGLRTQISVNTDLPVLASVLVNLTSHEIYGGHHTHHVWQEVDLVRGRDEIEWTLVLLWAPSSVVSEGVATTGPQIVVGDGQQLASEVLGGWPSRTTRRWARESRRQGGCSRVSRQTWPCLCTTAEPPWRMRASTPRHGRFSPTIGSRSSSHGRLRARRRSTNIATGRVTSSSPGTSATTRNGSASS